MLFGILIGLLPLLAGYLIKLKNRKYLRFIDKALGIIVYLILFIMGSELAQLEDFFVHLPSIILSTIVLFLCTFGINFLVLAIIDWFLPWRVANHSQVPISRLKMLLESLKITLALIGGFICGLFPLFIWQYNQMASKVVLIVLLILIGVQLRSNQITIKQILLNKMGLVSTTVITISALLGGILYAYLQGLPTNVGMAMSSGFGWYSLSGILMTEAQGAMIGSITFLNDIMRELFAIIFIPVLMRRFRLTALGVSGATSMDFTLPILQKSGGISIVSPAIVQGFLFTIIMPVLMTILNYYF